MPSKAFGELVAEELKTPFIEPQELRRMLDAGNAVTVLDGRPFDEYRTMSIPAAYNAPNATLVRYVGSLPNGDDLVVSTCPQPGASSVLRRSFTQPCVPVWRRFGTAQSVGP